MGTKYASQTPSGYNATPPADDGSVTEANKGYWATIKTKLADPVKVYADDINTAMATYADFGPITKSAAYTTTTAEHLKTIECTGTFTLTLGASAAMGAGYIVRVKNTGTGVITVDGSGAETIDLQASITLDPLQGVTVQVDNTGTEYLTIAQKGTQFPTPAITAGLANTYTVTTGETAYLTNKVYEVQINVTNTGASTIDFDSLGVKNIKILDGTDPIAGQLAAGQIVRFAYDGTNMVMTSYNSPIPADTVTQVMIQDAAVGQAQIKTATGSVTTGSSAPVDLILPGGPYGFWPRIAITAGGTPIGESIRIRTASASQVTTASLSSNTGNAAYLYQTYFQASPPYDYGDGEVGLNVFAMIDNATADIVSAYYACEAPWHYNGPTDIRAGYVREDGMPCRLVKRAMFERVVNGVDICAQLADPVSRDKIVEMLADPVKVELEIRQEIKNRDMGLVPHPFTNNDLTGKTVVMLDPVSDIAQRIKDIHDSGEEVGPIFDSGLIRLDNTPLVRVTPKGTIIVSASWKNTV